MYIGAFILLIGGPLSLGSFFGLLALLPLILAIVVRLLSEETFLVVNLPGYEAYRQRVKYRLIPFIW